MSARLTEPIAARLVQGTPAFRFLGTEMLHPYGSCFVACGSNQPGMSTTAESEACSSSSPAVTLEP